MLLHIRPGMFPRAVRNISEAELEIACSTFKISIILPKLCEVLESIWKVGLARPSSLVCGGGGGAQNLHLNPPHLGKESGQDPLRRRENDGTLFAIGKVCI
jgi:hypothetical protein